MTTAECVLTAEELGRRPERADGQREELVRGEIVVTPPPGFEHGLVQVRASSLLDSHVRPRRLGRITLESGVITQRGPDSVRGPDVAFWSATRLPLDQRPRGYPNVVADLCVEILSPGNAWEAILEKVREYLDGGVRMVWVIDPRQRTLAVYRPDGPERVLTESDDVNGEDVVPGFVCCVAEFFE